MVLDSGSKRAVHVQGKAATHSFYQVGYEQAAAATKYKFARYKSQEPIIPSPDIFDFESSTNNRTTVSADSAGFRLPLAAECAAHLELLEVFYVLRQRILRSPEIDAAMGIIPIRQTKTGVNGDTKTLKDPSLWQRRQDKWPKFIEFAVIRFLEWRKTLSTESHFYLPPLDVLMVWHSFLLNPRLLQTHCMDEPLYKMRMPWQKIHESIDNNEWNFNHHVEAAASFKTATGLSPDLFDQLSNWEPQLANLTTLTLDESSPPGRTPSPPCELPPSQKHYFTLFHTTPKDLAIQLRDAVIRQTAFIDKMNAHMWIRSPSLAGTLRRAISRYDKFLTLLKLYNTPQQTIVPTLDIDLVWHTHQCSSAVGYARGMKERVGRFVNHDDSIGKDTLEDGFGRTSKWFRIRFGMEYRVCGCWDCEGLLDEVEGVGAGDGREEVDMEVVAKRVNERVTFFRFAEFARRKKQPLPVWEESVMGS